MNQQEILAEIDHTMTEIDLLLWEWQTAADMMSFFGQDVPLKIYVDERPVEEAKVTVEKEPVLHMRFEGQWKPVGYEIGVDDEVPLVRYEDGKRIEIGTAKVNIDDGTIKAIVNHEGAGFLALPDLREISVYTAPEDLPQKKWWAARVTIPKHLTEDGYLTSEPKMKEN
jgi:hypothetical protein